MIPTMPTHFLQDMLSASMISRSGNLAIKSCAFLLASSVSDSWQCLKKVSFAHERFNFSKWLPSCTIANSKATELCSILEWPTRFTSGLVNTGIRTCIPCLLTNSWRPRLLPHQPELLVPPQYTLCLERVSDWTGQPSQLHRSKGRSRFCCISLDLWSFVTVARAPFLLCFSELY